MADYFFSSSLLPVTGDGVFFTLKEVLKEAGFTVPSSSNGTVFSAGDNITAPSDLATSNAWFIVRQPMSATASHGGVQREYAFQRGTFSRSWRAKYSYSSSFTGSATATVMPDADDQVRLIGNELPAFAFNTNFLATDATYRTFYCVDLEPPHGFYMVAISDAGATLGGGIIIDPMLSGTYNASDADPYVQYADRGGSQLLNGGITGGASITNCVTASAINTPACWTRKGESDQVYGGIGLMQFCGYDGGQKEFSDSGYATTNAYTGQDDLLPVIYYRAALANPPGVGGYKGVSSLIKLPSGPLRAIGDTFSTTSSGSRDYFNARHFALPNDGSEPIF